MSSTNILCNSAESPLILFLKTLVILACSSFRCLSVNVRFKGCPPLVMPDRYALAI
jgi:hypothetical protein